MCPDSPNGQHDFKEFSMVTDKGTIVVRVCTYCSAQG